MRGPGALILLVVLSASLGAPSATAADELRDVTVSFGVPRRQVVSGLDVAAACTVVASYAGLAMVDGGADETFLLMGPGTCAITVYVLGVAIPLPLGNAAPIGRTSYLIPGVGGLTFGLADVSIDVLMSVETRLTAEVSGLSVTPPRSSWTHWGATTLGVAASLGTSGSTMHFGLPFNVTMNLSIGASVFAFGFRLFSASLASLGTIAGTPPLNVPVAVDRVPSPVIASGWGRAPDEIRLNWTANTDDDFAHYRIVVVPVAGTELVFLVEDRAATNADLPASPDTEYTIHVSAVDRAGQSSNVSSVALRTPQDSVRIAPESPGVILAAVALSLLAGFGLGLLIRRRKKTEGP